MMRRSVKENIWVKYHANISMLIRDGIELGYYYSLVDDYALFDMTVIFTNILTLVEE
jgi:hypothetical protein